MASICLGLNVLIAITEVMKISAEWNHDGFRFYKWHIHIHFEIRVLLLPHLMVLTLPWMGTIEELFWTCILSRPHSLWPDHSLSMMNFIFKESCLALKSALCLLMDLLGYICRLCDDQVFHRLSGVFEGTLLWLWYIHEWYKILLSRGFDISMNDTQFYYLVALIYPWMVQNFMG